MATNPDAKWRFEIVEVENGWMLLTKHGSDNRGKFVFKALNEVTEHILTMRINSG